MAWRLRSPDRRVIHVAMSGKSNVTAPNVIVPSLGRPASAGDAAEVAGAELAEGADGAEPPGGADGGEPDGAAAAGGVAVAGMDVSQASGGVGLERPTGR